MFRRGVRRTPLRVSNMNNRSKYSKYPFEPHPDFNRLLAAISGKEPDRVPLLELFVEVDVKSEFLGEFCGNARAEVEFYYQAGYDYVPVAALALTPKNVRLKVHSGSKYADDGDRQRIWINEAGAITSFEALGKSFWPDPTKPLTSFLFSDIRKHLKPGMKICPMISGPF